MLSASLVNAAIHRRNEEQGPELDESEQKSTQEHLFVSLSP